MASDAFMELSSWSIMGETRDKEFGKKDMGSFEVSSIEFHTGYTPEEPDDKSNSDKDGKDGLKSRLPRRRRASHNSSGWEHEPLQYSLTVHKAIDYASPGLFRACCEKKEVAWAIIYLCEAGDPNRNPWLRLEFRKVHIVDFSWSLEPAANEEEELKMETVQFKFETMLIQYARQLNAGDEEGLIGAHTNSVQEGHWDFAHPKQDVAPIGDGSNEPSDP